MGCDGDRRRGRANNANFVGPNTLGILSPGRARCRHDRRPGRLGAAVVQARSPTGVGVISRSGGMASSTGYYLGQAGVKISTIVHVGGDAVLGMRIPDVAMLFQARPGTPTRS